MKLNRTRKPVTALVGCAVVSTIGLAGLAQADVDRLFVAEQLDGGYLLAAKSEAEGKCGEGKCGATDEAKADTEGKCGEGKCGASDETQDGAKAGTEGKCGEGKCGAADNAKTETEGKCGEGKCGSAA